MLEKQQPTRCKVTSDTLKTCVENRPEASEKGGCVQLTCTLANGVAWIHKCVSISLHLDTEMPVLFLPQERNAASARLGVWSVRYPCLGSYSTRHTQTSADWRNQIGKCVPYQLWSMTVASEAFKTALLWLTQGGYWFITLLGIEERVYRVTPLVILIWCTEIWYSALNSGILRY